VYKRQDLQRSEMVLAIQKVIEEYFTEVRSQDYKLRDLAEAVLKEQERLGWGLLPTHTSKPTAGNETFTVSSKP
jgi:hypothetical protein